MMGGSVKMTDVLDVPPSTRRQSWKRNVCLLGKEWR